jgi:energy-coupling factor transport system permease protein
MALARPVLLAAGSSLLLLLYLLAGFPRLDILLHMLKRLRWLMLAIFVVYGWWTPGTAVLPVLGNWSPSGSGLYAGLLRGVALAAIVAAVHLLLQRTPRAQLLPAVMQLLRPVCSHACRERLAVRSVLSIEAVALVQPLLSASLEQQRMRPGGLAALGEAARRIYDRVLERAAQADTAAIEIAELAAPPLWQWLIPLALVAALYPVV